MLTAREAYIATMDNINRYAKEFISNTLEDEIRGASDDGLFVAKVDVKSIRGGEATAKEVARLLKESGYQAEHVCSEYSHDCENYIYVDWKGTNDDI